MFFFYYFFSDPWMFCKLIVLYYHDENWENVDDILEICHHGNRFCDRWDKCDDIHRDVLDLYSYGQDGSEDEAFYSFK